MLKLGETATAPPWGVNPNHASGWRPNPAGDIRNKDGWVGNQEPMPVPFPANTMASLSDSRNSFTRIGFVR